MTHIRRIVGFALIALITITAIPSAVAPTQAQPGVVKSQPVPDEDETSSNPKSKPPKKQSGDGFRTPGPDGVVRGDPVVEPGDPGYDGPPPPPRPRPPAPQPPVLEPQPPVFEPNPPTPQPEPQPPAPQPQPQPPVVQPAPTKPKGPKPVLVPQPGDTSEAPAPLPEPMTPTQPEPAPDRPFPRPPEPIPEPSDKGSVTQPAKPKPQPQTEPQPQPNEPQRIPEPDSQATPSGLIKSGLRDPQGREFTYYGPGNLKPGTGAGVVSDTIFAPGMRYPVESAPGYPNSQVYNNGGYLGPGGGLCDAANYAYPWRDNFCEKRGWSTPACPGGKGHQGQDIRAMDCKKAVHWVVAVEDGVITSIGSWAVKLKGVSGREYSYLHMQMDALSVDEGSQVKRGQRIGKVSDNFGGSATSIHLHFEIKTNVALPGQPAAFRKVPPYSSLVDSYKRLLSGTP